MNNKIKTKLEEYKERKEDTNCYICRKETNCRCYEETTRPVKERSCAVRKDDEYPFSQFFPVDDGAVILIHICSQECHKKVGVKIREHYKKIGLQIIYSDEDDDE